MVHNHPHEKMLVPSAADTDLTNHMYQVGKFLDLPVLDHLVINETRYFSFDERGVLARLAKSKKYVLQYKEEAERLKKEGEKMGIQKGRVEGEKAGLQKGLQIGRKEGEKVGIKKGEERGLKKGQELGAVQKAIQMAKALKKKGIDVKVIADVSGLSIEQIKKL